ncbi:hypothetical protein SBA3_3310008 [Candidatus Sulfopaludibacter sp. SbA3]|nr:hypothetical protein SBA3_3310008 [Candidatus Sulfopaludibacter sp. SbA3]
MIGFGWESEVRAGVQSGGGEKLRFGISERGKLEPGTKIRQKAANFEPGTDLQRIRGSGFSKVLGGPLAGNDGYENRRR